MCVGLVGCQVSTAPTPVAELDRTHAVSMIRAAWNGQYALYLVAGNRKGQRTVVRSAHLKKNDPLGFRQRDTGPVAVAGDLEVPLQPGRYEWVMQPDPGQRNWLATVLLTAVIVGATIAIISVVAIEAAAKDASSHIFRSGSHR